MNPKVLKIIAVVVGVLLVWVAILLVRGQPHQPKVRTQLEFWNVFDKTDEIKPLLADFTRRTGIRVNYRSFTDIAEYRQTLLLELAAGEGPDVLAIHNSWIAKYRGLFAPLPTADLGFTVADVRENFVDAVTESVVFQSESDGAGTSEILALPMYLDTLALFYNRTVFRNVLSKPYAAPELTWAGVRDDVAEITIRDDDDPEGFRLAGIALGRTDNISRGVELFYTLYRQLGGEDLALASKERMRDADGRSYQPLAIALSNFTDFSRDSSSEEFSWNAEIGAAAPEQEVDAFVRGRVAMIAGYSYYHSQILSLIQQHQKKGTRGVIKISDVGINPLPQVLDPREGNPKTVLADFFALAVAKSSQHPQAAWQLILALTERDAQRQYHAATQKPTSRRDLIEEQRVDPLFGVFAEQAVYATTLPIADDELYSAVVSAAVNAIADGELTIAEAAHEIVQKITAK